MEREVINKWLGRFGLGIVALSVLEIISIIILGVTPLEINGSAMTMHELILTSGLFPLEGTLVWIFLLLIICGFLILGVVLIFMIKKKNIALPYFAKYSIVIGILLLIGAFNKMEYVHILQRTSVDVSPAALSFQSILIDPDFTPFYVLIFWNFFSVVVCTYTVVSLIIAAGGLNITLKFERKELPK